jgi:hypothetical protein
MAEGLIVHNREKGPFPIRAEDVGEKAPMAWPPIFDAIGMCDPARTARILKASSDHEFVSKRMPA